MKISAVIITRDEERNIADCIKSVEWADEVLVVDSGSEDATTDIAVRLGARVVAREWRGFADQKQFAAETAANDWILSLDADERVTAELAREIDDLRSSSRLADHDAYSIPRLSVYMGREIRHGGWYPDRQTRLFDRRRASWRRRVIHESIELERPDRLGRLQGDIVHYSVRSAAEHARMIVERYAPLSAEQMLADGRTTSPLRIALAGPEAFFRSYLLRAGCLDGFPGFCIAGFAAFNSFLKHLLLYDKQRSRRA
ncbi:MAG: glycosyltransferase family 2 protein [Pyrinomonadaceae bacterium]